MCEELIAWQAAITCMVSSKVFLVGPGFWFCLCCHRLLYPKHSCLLSVPSWLAALVSPEVTIHLNLRAPGSVKNGAACPEDQQTRQEVQNHARYTSEGRALTGGRWKRDTGKWELGQTEEQRQQGVIPKHKEKHTSPKVGIVKHLHRKLQVLNSTQNAVRLSIWFFQCYFMYLVLLNVWPILSFFFFIFHVNK